MSIELEEILRMNNTMINEITFLTLSVKDLSIRVDKLTERINNIAPIKKAPMTAAERMRRYRARKKEVKYKEWEAPNDML